MQTKIGTLFLLTFISYPLLTAQVVYIGSWIFDPQNHRFGWVAVVNNSKSVKSFVANGGCDPNPETFDGSLGVLYRAIGQSHNSPPTPN